MPGRERQVAGRLLGHRRRAASRLRREMMGGDGSLDHPFDRARALSVPVHALDAPPRGGFSGLRRRDEHAARRIVAILSADPETGLLVLFGESHLARAHLPRRTRRPGRWCACFDLRGSEKHDRARVSERRI